MCFVSTILNKFTVKLKPGGAKIIPKDVLHALLGKSKYSQLFLVCGSVVNQVDVNFS